MPTFEAPTGSFRSEVLNEDAAALTPGPRPDPGRQAPVCRGGTRGGTCLHECRRSRPLRVLSDLRSSMRTRRLSLLVLGLILVARLPCAGAEREAERVFTNADVRGPYGFFPI